MRRALLTPRSIPSTYSRQLSTFTRRYATISPDAQTHSRAPPPPPPLPPPHSTVKGKGKEREEDAHASIVESEADHFQQDDDMESHWPGWDELRDEPGGVTVEAGGVQDLIEQGGRMHELGEVVTSDEDQDWFREEVEAEVPTRAPNATRPEIQPTTTSSRPSPPRLKPLPTFPGGPRTLHPNVVNSPIRPYIPPLLTSSDPQPHHQPLLSRNDWRLSSPIIPRRPTDPLHAHTLKPPNLRARRKQEHLRADGHNFLLGIGAESMVENVRYRETKVEKWGWKTKVPDSEIGTWSSADEHRKGLDRLIALTRVSDEERYLLGLSRSGTPAERELAGRTATACCGEWIAEAAQEGRIDQAMTRDVAKGQGQMLVAVWKKKDGLGLGPEAGYKFGEGAILRFTKEESVLEKHATVPRAPEGKKEAFFRQGHLIEINDGDLVVGFDEDQAWHIGSDEDYRIDFGLDTSSYALQTLAIDNLYFDPVSQKRHNSNQVAAGQDAFYNGVNSNLREWSLRGTELRELLVPDLGSSSATSSPVVEDDHLPAAEIAHLPPAHSLLPSLDLGGMIPSHPSTIFAENQLINSWIKRHQRSGGPLEMEGDPILGLNESQMKAVALAMGEKLSLIQGPPGTGKSATLVALIRLLKSHFRIPQPILLTAPTHVSTDHLLSLLVKAGLSPLRSGRVDKIRADLHEWSIEKRREEHPLWKKCEEARLQSEEARKAMVAFKGAPKTDKKDDSITSVEQAMSLHDDYLLAWRRFILFEQRLYSSLLATADVFCATAMGSGPSKIMSMVDFPIVFLDEAAMCTEPVTLIPLMKGAEHVSLIGDHKQLPAVVTSATAKQERLHVSLFERLMSQKTVKSILLDTQYRMRPLISAFPNEKFYARSLKNDKTVSARPAPPVSRFFNKNDEGDFEPTVFISHTFPEANANFSTKNDGEVDIIVDVVGDLLARNVSLEASDIGIISPYAAQTRSLTQTFKWDAGTRLQGLLGFGRAMDVGKVEVNTIDGFQGREKKVIILSTVRSNKTGHIGFLSDQRRLNVALTRAKDALIVVGNEYTLRSAKASEWTGSDKDAHPGIWIEYLTWLRERKLIKVWDSGKTV